jgi:hypothetical protein
MLNLHGDTGFRRTQNSETPRFISKKYPGYVGARGWMFYQQVKVPGIILDVSLSPGWPMGYLTFGAIDKSIQCI